MRSILVSFVIGMSIYLLCAPSLPAQAGLKAGVNFSTLSEKGAGLVSISWGSATGFTVGAFYTANINENLAFQPEIYYSKKGGQLEGSVLSVLGEKSIAIHYLEVPLLFKLKFPTQASISPSVFIGPYGAVKLSDKGQIKVLGVKLEEELIGIKDTDFGFVFGGGFDFKVSNAKLILDIRYDLGLTNIARPIVGVENEMKTRSFVLMLGYGF